MEDTDLTKTIMELTLQQTVQAAPRHAMSCNPPSWTFCDSCVVQEATVTRERTP